MNVLVLNRADVAWRRAAQRACQSLWFKGEEFTCGSSVAAAETGASVTESPGNVRAVRMKFSRLPGKGVLWCRAPARLRSKCAFSVDDWFRRTDFNFSL